MSPPASIERSFHDLVSMFYSRVEATPDREAFRFPRGAGKEETWRSLTWRQTADRVGAIAAGLLSLGIEPEQRCGLLASTRIEWILADFGVMCAGGATTTVYPSTTVEECAYILSDSGCRVVFAEDTTQLTKLRSKRDELPALHKVVLFDGEGDGDWVLGLGDLEALGRSYLRRHPDALEKVAVRVGPEQLATLIYTSGTTGRPKGVRLVHECWAYEGEAIREMNMLAPEDLHYLWLPLSHAFGKVLLAGQLVVGYPTAVDGRLPRLVRNLAVIRPVFMAAAPRIFEKMHGKVLGDARAAGGLQYRIFRWALARGRDVSLLRQKGRQPRGWLALQNKLADRLVFSKLKQGFGGRLRFFISGSAPLAKEIAEFFHAADILILEGYGLTETSAATFVNRPWSYAFGTVGEPVPGTEVRIDPVDGEVLIRSPAVMRGYHNLPEVSDEVLEDGWMRTGDIGELDGQGRLRITDRKKDLIKTSGGKYVAPQHIEGRFKALCPVASQMVVHGDRRKYCTALITLDAEAISGWAASNGVAEPYEKLTQHPAVRGLVQECMNQLNATLASHETIKGFALLDKDFTVEGGELTPSLKVKRKLVEQKYEKTLDALYTK